MSKLDLSYLLAPHTCADFFAQHWQKSSLLIKRTGPERFRSLIPATDVSATLSLVEQFPVDAVDLVGSATTARRAPESTSSLADFFTKGSTIRARQLERFVGTLKTLCRSIEQELRSPTHANLYCTPAASRGFDLHFDTHDVLVLQVFGKKRWQAYEPIVKLPLEHVPPLPFETDPEALRRSRGGREMGQGKIRTEELGALAIDTILEPGDCLYLPRGFVHGAEALDEASVHLTIGIHVLTWLDLFAVALGQSGYRHQALREALPVGFLDDAETRNDLGREFAERIRLFSQDAQFEAALDALTESFNRNFDATRETVASDSLDHQTKLEGKGQLQLYASADGTMTGLALGQNTFWMPVGFAPAMRFIVEHPSFYPHELPGQITDSGKLTFLRRLVDDGFLRIVD